MNAARVNLNPLSAQSSVAPLPDDALSALVDGELSADELDVLLASERAAQDGLENWHTYQVIGDVLRGEKAVLTALPPGDFLSAIREGLRLEDAGAQKADVSSFPVSTDPVSPRRAPAANDAVFRWKFVAGLASLAAVLAVSWTVLNGASSGANSAAPQLAVAPAAPESAATVAAQAVERPSTAVVVNTGQGPLIRDARLEELLAEHRQNGGMSALQMPTGFIRNATYDSTGR